MTEYVARSLNATVRQAADNPDCVDISCLVELIEFIGNFNKPLNAAKEIYGDLTDESVLKVIFLRQYVEKKIGAIQARLDGDVSKALLYERVCESIYANMPQEMQW